MLLSSFLEILLWFFAWISLTTQGKRKNSFQPYWEASVPLYPPPGKMVTSPSIVLTANDVHVFYKIQVDVHHAIDFNVFSIQCNIRNSVFKPGPCSMRFSYHKLYIILISVSFWHATSYLFIHSIKKQIGSPKTEVTKKKMEDMAFFFIR